MRQLLAGYPQVEMASQGHEYDLLRLGRHRIDGRSRTCAQARARQRMAEFAESGAETCITGLHGLRAPAGTDQPTGPGQALPGNVFGIQVDYEQVERNTQAMWEGGQGEINIQRLAQTGILPARCKRTAAMTNA